MSLILTTAEAAAELTASSAAPYFCTLLAARLVRDGGGALTCRVLARVAYIAYLASALAALVAYGLYGALGHAVPGSDSVAAMWALAAAWVIQYPAINQLGDAAVDMALPHWLRTFEGAALRVPLSGEAPANASSLSVLVLLFRVVLGAAAIAAYIACRNSAAARLALLLTLAALCMAGGFAALMGAAKAESGVVDHAINNNQDTAGAPSSPPEPLHSAFDVDSDSPGRLRRRPGVRPLWSLRAFEVQLVAFAVFVINMPAQAQDALAALLAMRLGEREFGAIVAVATVAIVAYFLWRLRRESKRPLHLLMPVSRAAGTNSKQGDTIAEATGKVSPTVPVPSHASLDGASDGDGVGSYTSWLKILWSIVLSLAGAALVALLFPGGGSYGTAPLLLAFLGLHQALKSRFLAYMYHHPEDRVSDVQYWINVCSVILSGPLLCINWALLDDQGGDDQGGDSEARQATVVGVTTGAVFLLAAFWFQLAPAANNAAEGCDSLRRAVDAAAASGGVSEQHVALAAGPPADGGGAEAHEARL